ncbi:MAG: SurA N-terminal domain-containing protein [Ekhidna sp.]|nr:SurA N-terminal domain-containing protein [Ekhidna sp.]
MALIGTLRNKMGKIVVGVIMLTMIAFIGTDLIGNSTLLGGGQNQDIAEIAGNTISNVKFQNKVEELSYNFALNSGRNPIQQEIDQIRNQAWNALIFDKAYQLQFDELGIEVTNDELVDMVQGSNISPQIIQFFSDPATGQFDKSRITNFLASLQQAQPQQRNSWISFERSLLPGRLIEKYNNLFAKTNYVTGYEAAEEYTSQNANASIEYVFVPFSSISDSLITVADDELKDYLIENASEYERDEARSMEYVAFDILPLPTDSADAREEVAALREGLIDASDDSTFVKINSDDPFSFLTYSEEDLPDSLKEKSIGYVSRPVISNGFYEFQKLSGKEEYAPDSILYKVARIKKDITLYISDKTINEKYREAGFFAASCGNLEELRRLAKEKELRIQTGDRIDKNAQRVGILTEARSLVLWLYNDAEGGVVSDVKEIGNKYIVAAMTGIQEEGVANLEDVRNRVEREIRNEKKAAIIIEKFTSLEVSSIDEVVNSYGDGAKTGTSDFQLSSSNITGVGYAPEAIGVAFALDEEEMKRPFAIQDGVLLIKLLAKDIPSDIDDYTPYATQVSGRRLSNNALIADFPLSYFRLFISKDIHDAVKDFAEIEDMRYKFF